MLIKKLRENYNESKDYQNDILDCIKHVKPSIYDKMLCQQDNFFSKLKSLNAGFSPTEIGTSLGPRLNQEFL